MGKVSVIIPIYKVEKYLKKTIDSVLRQTLKDIELILVNDGSPDGSGKIAEKYKFRDSRVKVIHKENGGISSARNAGLKLATCDYVLFIDSDDWIENEMIYEMYLKAIKYDADLVVCNYSKIYQNYIERDILSIRDEVIDISEFKLEQYLINYSTGDIVWNKLYKRSIIEANHVAFQENIAEDTLFNLFYVLHTKKVCTISKSFYNYLQRVDSIMHSFRPNPLIQYLELYEIFVEYSSIYIKHEELQHYNPIFFSKLIISAIKIGISSGESVNKLESLLEIAQQSVYFRKNMKNILLGKIAKVYYQKKDNNVIKIFQIKLIAFLLLVKMYKTLFKLIKLKVVITKTKKTQTHKFE